jgi:16S rRNA (cytidine1402-2'-O)-methyltransferase
LIFYEAPHRMRETLASMAVVFGKTRELTIARELTKRHEEFWRGTVGEAIDLYETKEPQGEYTLIVAGAEVSVAVLTEVQLKAEMRRLLDAGESRSAISKQLAAQTDFPKRQLYQWALELPDE